MTHLSCVLSVLESESCLWFNTDVAADSSCPALRQQGDSSRSSIWVLHSCRPYTLPSQRSRDITAVTDRVASCPPTGVRGVRNTLTELRVMGTEANGSKEPNNPIPQRRWSPSPTDTSLNRQGEETKERFSVC
ncbi:hypothetical protein ABVT39_026830 [Epinephelus coioides]